MGKRTARSSPRQQHGRTQGASYAGFEKAANAWVKRDIPVFPTAQKSKRPLTSNGYKDATTDPTQIKDWARKHPQANVGISLEAAHLLVADCDPRNGGDKSLDELTRDRLLPQTWCALTPGGGTHHYFKNPNGIRSFRLAPGIDIKAVGGYVIAPESKGYRWHTAPDQVQLADPPDWLLQRGPHGKGAGAVESADRALTGLPVGHRSLRALERGLPEPEEGQTHREVAVGIARNLVEAGRHENEVRVLMAQILEHEDSALDPNRPWTSQDVEDIVSSVTRDAAPDSAEHRESRFERDVGKELTRLRVREEARQRHQAEGVEKQFPFPEPGWTLEQELAQPEPERIYRVDGLQVAGTNAVLVAGYKLGKTTVEMNLARSLADGTPLFGKFQVEQIDGRIAIFNYELTREQWNRWARDMEIKNPDRIVPVHLRGQGTVPLWVPEFQDRVTEWMIRNEIRYWILDPTAKAWEGRIESEGDNIGVGDFLNGIDLVKERAGVPEAHLSHHTGRSTEAQERGRGATRLEDWMDAGWYLTGERDDLYFHAFGRDVDLEKIAVVYDEETARTFTATGQTREEARKEEGALRALEAVAKLEAEGVPEEERGTNRVTSEIPGNRNEKSGWVQEAERRLWIKRSKRGQAKFVSVTQLGREMLKKKAQE